MKIVIEKGINKGYIMRLEGSEIGLQQGACILDTWEEVLRNLDQIHKAYE